MISGRIGFFGSTTHPEAAGWAARVVTNGGSVSASTLTAVDTFCKAIDTAGIRSKFLRLNLFAGTGLSACLVPLYRGTSQSGTQYGNTTDTNSNFVTGDYTETGTSGGLVGNGSTKRLATGMDMVAAGLSHTDTHASWYSRAQITVNNAPISTFGGGVAQASFGALVFGSLNLLYYRSGGASNCGIEGASWSGANRSGHVLCQRNASDAKVYRNGTDLNLAVTMTNTNNWSVTSPGAPSIFARNRADSSNSGDSFLAATLQGYSIGTSFSASQASAFYSAMQAFQTSLGRNL
jgi:hypothetical protein